MSLRNTRMCNVSLGRDPVNTNEAQERMDHDKERQLTDKDSKKYPGMILLELQNVAKIFGNRLIFKDVNLVVTRGTVSLLVGANGAGKSTLMRLMAGLLRPTSGACVCHAPEERIAYLGHATFVYPGLSALENLTFWKNAQASSLPETRLMALLEQVGLERYAHERAGIFSRGMSQRLNLARALMHEPDILLLDEPGTGLDSKARVILRQEITHARERGAGVLWISLDAVTDAPLADRVLTLDRGRLHDGAQMGAPC